MDFLLIANFFASAIIFAPPSNSSLLFFAYSKQPEELSVKTEGNVLVILAKHETQTETGGSFVSKQFEQRFSLPSGKYTY